MNPPTTLTNHNPPATIGCGLNPNPIRREESDTPQSALSRLPNRAVHLRAKQAGRAKHRAHHSAVGLS